MYQSTSRTLVMALAVVVFVTLLPDANAASAVPCRAELASTPAGRADLWRKALQRFTAEHADLTAEQARFVSQAVQLGDDLATQQKDERTQAAFIQKAKKIVERSHELFSNGQLGALYSSMGPLQKWFGDVIQSTAFCDCIGSGSCTMGGGPSGTCQAGCTSWDGTDGQRRDGLCGSAAAE
jgi:hypothetical protein